MMWLSITVGAGTLLATAVFGCLAALRAQYERVLKVIDFISSATVADARHRLGLIIHAGPAATPAAMPAGRDERVKDLFAVLWAFTCINAVRQTLSRHGGPYRLLGSGTQAWVSYWRSNLSQVQAILHLTDSDIAGSDLGLAELIQVWPTNN